MNYIAHFFDMVPIFWINLKKSLDRHEKMLSRLQDYPYNYCIEAVDGTDPITFKNDYQIKYKSNINYTTALIAVICSHAKCIKEGYDKGYEIICVLEDDAHFELIELYPHRLVDIIAKAPENWEIIQIYHTGDLGIHLNNYTKEGINIFPRHKNYSGTCYLINRKGMEKFLREIVITDGKNNFEIVNLVVDPEDVIFSRLKSYVLNLPFLYYYDDKTTFNNYINGDHHSRTQAVIIQYNAKEALIKFIEQLNSK